MDSSLSILSRGDLTFSDRCTNRGLRKGTGTLKTGSVKQVEEAKVKNLKATILLQNAAVILYRSQRTTFMSNDYWNRSLTFP